MGFRQWLSKAEEAEASRLPPNDTMEQEIIGVLRSVFDPEIPINIYDLGLIYGLEIHPESGNVHIRMTLTAPACPIAETFPDLVADAVRQVDGVGEVEVELVWEPPWSQARMSEAARLELGLV